MHTQNSLHSVTNISSPIKLCPHLSAWDFSGLAACSPLTRLCWTPQGLNWVERREGNGKKFLLKKKKELVMNWLVFVLQTWQLNTDQRNIVVIWYQSSQGQQAFKTNTFPSLNSLVGSLEHLYHFWEVSHPMSLVLLNLSSPSGSSIFSSWASTLPASIS